MKTKVLAFAAIFATSSLILSGLLLLTGCVKDNVNTQKVLTIQELAKEHSAALDFFYNTAISNGLVFDVNGVKSSSKAENVINEETVSIILGNYNFSSVSSIKLPIVQTKSGNSISDDYSDSLGVFLEEIVSNQSFSSFANFSDFVLSSMDLIDNNCLLNEYHDFTELALYVLLDSYDYWINQEKFAEWVTTICTPEQQYQIALAIGHPELVNTTQSSGAEMRAWAEMCKSNDEETNGLLSRAVKSDAWGIAGSAVGGAAFGGLGVASCLFGAAWSSIGTLLGI